MTVHSDSDALASVIAHYRPTARVYATPSVCGAWRVNTQGMHRVGFHLVVRGSCWLHLPGLAAPQALRTGDLVFLTADSWHVLSPEVTLDGDDMRLVDEGAGPRTDLICGSIEFGDSAAPLLRSLPDVVLLHAGDGAHGGRLESVARLMAQEVRASESGHGVVLDRLSDVLFVLVLRHAVERGLVRGGLLGALADPRIGRALAALHADPGANWTLPRLAERAHLSRTLFSQRFAELVGEPPMQYLAAWRMQLAEAWLREQRYSVAQVAERLGYGTEAAFRRAFKRHRGVGPGRVRRGDGMTAS